jgi:hypothetical protein
MKISSKTFCVRKGDLKGGHQRVDAEARRARLVDPLPPLERVAGGPLVAVEDRPAAQRGQLVQDRLDAKLESISRNRFGRNLRIFSLNYDHLCMASKYYKIKYR